MVIMHVWCAGLRVHSGEIAGKIDVRPLFLQNEFFCFSWNSVYRFWVQVLWHLWIGGAQHPGPSPRQIEVFNVGGWLTHGDMVYFLSVVD